MGNGIVAGRILGDGGDDGTFGKVQFIDIFSEVPFGCGLDTKGVLSQIDGIHVIFQYFILIHIVFELDGKILLLEFTLYFNGKGLFAFTCPAGKNVVLDKLLGDSAGAFGKVTGGEPDEAGPENTLDIDSVMVIEPCVFDSNKGVGQILGDLVHAYGNPVGSFCVKLGNLVSFGIVYEGGEACRGYVNIGNIRC